MPTVYTPRGMYEHIALSLCEVGGPASMINLPQCVLMCFCKSSVCVQLKSQYACMPHSPTRRDPSLPGRWVRCASPAQPTHPPRGQHPAAGCCPPPRWAETNYPSVINQLPARESPFLFMTEATSMVPCVIAIVHVNNYK